VLNVVVRFLRDARALCPCLAILVLLFLVFPQAVTAGSPGKKEQTNTFWQLDPDADFEGDGSNFCAPAAVSNGLIYLARARGRTNLVDGTDRYAQIALIKALAEHMETDPEIGTNPSKIIYGLDEYLKSKGFAFDRLEIAGWRRIDADHKGYLISRNPDMKWLREAAKDPDTVVILNNGWYRNADEGYIRKGGHFVIVVGAGPGVSEFQVHNPAMEPARQKENTSVSLTPIHGSLIADATSNGVEELDLAGYFKMEGPGLPFTSAKAAFAALDFVIVFKVKNQE
jgi:hypothetical protein